MRFKNLDALRALIFFGAKLERRGEFVDYSLNALIADLDDEAHLT